MVDRDRHEPAGPAGRHEELIARREAQRRNRARAQRRRLIALALALLTVAAIVGLASLAGGSDDGKSERAATEAATKAAPAGKARGESAAGPVRNATPQADWMPHTGPVPILEYHVLGAPAADAPYPELYVSRPDFRAQMDWLDSHDYQAVTLEQVQDAWDDGATLPPKPVVISFDDGYRPQFTFALPQLRAHGWAGVLNLKAEGSDLYGSNVRAMVGAGWELASHTIDHSDLTTLDAAALRREVAGSRRLLRREYGVPVSNFCYPAGRYDAAVVAAVKAAGYRGATTEIPGYASRQDPYELARFEILGSSGVSGLAADLSGG